MQVTPDKSVKASPPKSGDSAAIFSQLRLAEFAKRHRVPMERIHKLAYAIFQNFETVETASCRLDDATRQKFLEEFEPVILRPVQVRKSELDESTKFVFETSDALKIETVSLKYGDKRSSVCISSQSGCRAGCVFCATARMGLQRDLTAAEILSQVLLVAEHSKRQGHRLRNAVFMGMGEPLHNFEAVCESINFLTHLRGFAMPQRRINVSTVGVPERMPVLADRFPGIQLALSLHSAIEEKRRKLVPYSKQYPWEALRQALRDIARRPRTHRHHGPVMIEHILIDGVNDQDEDSEALVGFLAGLHVMVNLIPYNPISYVSQWGPSPKDRREAFANKLRQAGHFTTIRYSMGSDVGAACGQLVQQIENNPSRQVE